MTTYLNGLIAAVEACHERRRQCLQERREAIARNEVEAQHWATAEALGVWMCPDRKGRSR